MRTFVICSEIFGTIIGTIVGGIIHVGLGVAIGVLGLASIGATAHFWPIRQS